MVEEAGDRLGTVKLGDGPETIGGCIPFSRLGASPRLQMDWEHLNLLSDGCPEFEVELLQLFVSDSVEHLSVLKQAIALQNAKQGGQLSHHLKGASANVGIRSLQQIATQLESCFEHHQFQQAGPLVTEFESLLQEVMALI